MVPVGNRFVTAAGAVDMSRFVACQGMSGRANIGILVIDLEAMLVDVISVRIMEMPIMQVVNVALMLDRGVTATGAMGVVVTFVNVAFRHFGPPSANQNQLLIMFALFGMFDHDSNQEVTSPSIRHPRALEDAPRMHGRARF